MQNTPLNEYEESVLRVIQSRRLTHEQLMEEFSSPTRLKATVVRFIGSLLEREYIRKAKRLKGAYVIPLNGDIPDGLFEEEEVYELTPLGMNFLAKSTAMFTSFNNISNSNIANLL